MLGQSPPPYQSIGVGMLKDSSLMGIFLSSPPNIDIVTVNMVASYNYDPKGNQIVESTSLSPHEEIYNIIQTLSMTTLMNFIWWIQTLTTCPTG